MCIYIYIYTWACVYIYIHMYISICAYMGMENRKTGEKSPAKLNTVSDFNTKNGSVHDIARKTKKLSS